MIGVFDSGIGGLTVLKEIIKLLPNYKYVYYSDSINNPYDGKDKDVLINIVDNIVNILINKGCKIIVIACNTASFICKDYLRNKYKDIKIIAIEPAINLVNENEKSVMLSTLSTSKYINSTNNNLIIHPCINLAPLIEENNQVKINNYIKDNLYKYKDFDNIILGCTHYPLIIDNLKLILGNHNYIDGSIGVSKEVKRKVLELNLEESKFNIEFIDSSNNIDKYNRFKSIIFGD